MAESNEGSVRFLGTRPSKMMGHLMLLAFPPNGGGFEASGCAGSAGGLGGGGGGFGN